MVEGLDNALFGAIAKKFTVVTATQLPRTYRVQRPANVRSIDLGALCGARSSGYNDLSAHLARGHLAALIRVPDLVGDQQSRANHPRRRISPMNELSRCLLMAMLYIRDRLRA